MSLEEVKSVFEPEKPDVPGDWSVAPFSDVVEVVSDKGKRTKQREYLEEGRIPVIDQGQGFIGGYIDNEEMAFDGDLPIIVFGDHTRAIKYVTQRFAVGADGVKLLKPTECFDPKFFYYLLKSLQIPSRGYSRHFQFLKKFHLPIAPPEQQIRIVAEIEKQFSRLDEAVANLKRVKANLKRYKAAVLKAAVEGKLTEEWRKKNSDVEPANKLLERILTERREKWQGRGKYKEPVAPDTSGLPELPAGWVWARIGLLPVDVFDGPFGSNLKSSDYVPAGVRVIRLENIGSREFVNCKESFVTEQKYEQLKKHEVRRGDIIFSSFVSNETRVVMLPEHIDKAINKADCFCVRVNGNIINKRYLETFLATRIAYEQLVGQVHGATRPRINTTQLKECLIPIPPEDEQVEIMSQLSSVFSIVEVAETEIERNHQRADRLRQSILKHAFSGKLLSSGAVV